MNPLEASVQLFFVRKGRVVGRKGIVVDKVEDVETPALVARVIEQLYADAPREDVPKEILVERNGRPAAFLGFVLANIGQDVVRRLT